MCEDLSVSWREFICPNKEAIERRDAFLSDINTMNVQYLPDGAIVADVPYIKMEDY